MTTDYAALKTEIETYLSSIGVKYDIRLIGDSCPPFCDDKGKPGIGVFPRKTHIHGHHYQLTITRASKAVMIDFWNSYHDAELRATQTHFPVFGYNQRRATSAELKKTKVLVADILGCVQFYAQDSFDDFCSEFGYDTDSRKAEGVYQAVQKQAKELKAFFTADEIGVLAEKVGEL